MKFFLILSIISTIYGYSFEDEDTYKIFISSTKGNITREKLTTKKNVSVLDISFSTVEGIAPDSFCALPNLTSLNINGNSEFPRVTKELFKCNTKLNYISFTTYEKTQALDRDAFTDLKELFSLRINGVDLKRVGKDMFTGLNLGVLNLDSCSISEIDSDAFSSLPNLKDLTMGHNLITTIKPGTFNNLPKLNELLLNKNQIGEINWQDWNTLPSLKTIDFADNPLTKIDVTKIKEYFPLIESCNLGDAFNATRKAEIVEEGKKLNIHFKFIDYYRSYA